MKQDPELTKAQELMQPGKITRDGFLGDDARPLRTILADDDARVGTLGTSHVELAERMQALTEQAQPFLGSPLIIDDVLEVRVEDTRGKLPCPFPHPGLYRKTVTKVRRTDTGEELFWTALQVHMIEAHGFYEGAGANYRLDPAKLHSVINP